MSATASSQLLAPHPSATQQPNDSCLAVNNHSARNMQSVNLSTISIRQPSQSSTRPGDHCGTSQPSSQPTDQAVNQPTRQSANHGHSASQPPRQPASQPGTQPPKMQPACRGGGALSALPSAAAPALSATCVCGAGIVYCVSTASVVITIFTLNWPCIHKVNSVLFVCSVPALVMCPSFGSAAVILYLAVSSVLTVSQWCQQNVNSVSGTVTVSAVCQWLILS